MRKSLPNRTVETIIEFGNTLINALQSKDRNETIPQIEDKINDIVDNLNPRDLGLLGMMCVLLLSKIAYCNPNDEENNIKTAVVCCKAIVKAIDQSGSDFNMSHFDISTYMCLNPIFKPSAEQLKNAILSTHFEDMEPAGEC